MIDSKIIKIEKINLPNVSRETLEELEEYSQSILNTNKKINLISSSTEKSINTRHIYDSAQTIDFINKNDIKICTDLGSGAGLPSIVLGILMKPKKQGFKNSEGCNEANPKVYQRVAPFPKSVPKIGSNIRLIKEKTKPINANLLTKSTDIIDSANIVAIDSEPKITCLST